MKLVIFDVDGTLVDSQADIVHSVERAFAAVGRLAPSRADTLGIVGLSLEQAMQRLAPEAADDHRAMVAAYKAAYLDLHKQGQDRATLFHGISDLLASLKGQDDVLLGVATGKSKRGLDRLIESHGLEGFFVTQQVADFHPSKPHPSMIEACLTETGVTEKDAMMIGDTSYDMEMAAAAGVRGIGVTWGYHPRARLGAASALVDDVSELSVQLKDFIGGST